MSFYFGCQFLTPRRRATGARAGSVAAAWLAVASLVGCAHDAGDTAPAIDQAAAEARAHAHMAADPPDWEAAHAEFRRAAEGGSPTAMSYLGWIHEEGHGVDADGERAVYWYARAARAGAHDFAVKVGWMYLAGAGVDRDAERAEAWFQRAIDADHPPARVALASVLVSNALGGRDTDRVDEARELLEAALNDGQITASYFLARLYMEGIGGHPVDSKQAADYTRIGADDGDARMQGWLAWMLANGEGVARDPVEAAKWANLAAAEGDAFGDDLRRALEAGMTDEDVHRARQRAVSWALVRR